MLTFLYGQDKAVAKFVASLIPWCHRGFDDNIKTIGILDENGAADRGAGLTTTTIQTTA